MKDFLSCFAPPVVTDFYCIKVFGKLINSTQIAKLDKLRQRAAKKNMAMKFTNGEKLFADLGWENYKTRIEYLSICLFHKSTSTRPDHKLDNASHLSTSMLIQPEVRGTTTIIQPKIPMLTTLSFPKLQKPWTTFFCFRFRPFFVIFAKKSYPPPLWSSVYQ